ncbi:AbrB/MazE/SpoVT family DNA-binding domain-containing protein [Kitasatospora sp. NPDC048722]|uniref:AbrB/MazE/SpoVT family DNA-binding domain-containing protein n=1 Tax=Kitasatospora sp. NPDC048722 TaxID=3155639 RepID=UPI0033F6BD42
MIREPAEVTIDSDGRVVLPLGLLAEAGLDPGTPLLAYCDGDGRIILRRESDAIQHLLDHGEF